MEERILDNLDNFLKMSPYHPHYKRDSDSLLLYVNSLYFDQKITKEERQEYYTKLSRKIQSSEVNIYLALSWFDNLIKKGWNNLSIKRQELESIVKARLVCIKFYNWMSYNDISLDTEQSKKFYSSLAIPLAKKLLEDEELDNDFWESFYIFKYAMVLNSFSFKLKGEDLTTYLKVLRLGYFRYLKEYLKPSPFIDLNMSTSFNSEVDLTWFIEECSEQLMEVCGHSSIIERYKQVSDRLINMYKNKEITEKKYYILKNLLDSSSELSRKPLKAKSSILGTFNKCLEDNDIRLIKMYPRKELSVVQDFCRDYCMLITPEFLIKEVLDSRLGEAYTMLYGKDREREREEYFSLLEVLHSVKIIEGSKYDEYYRKGEEIYPC